VKPAVWRIWQINRWHYADEPSKSFRDRPAWQPLYASAGTNAGREVLAAWMIRQGYATGHGETMEALLQELELGIAESWTRALVNGVEGEREACAKVCEEIVIEGWRDAGWDMGTIDCAAAIRARGQG
jgi:hypothetical protein